ncbi:family 43 glycosylhydrolase [Mucisphaera calidilacus]|uniref:Glycosyl hydrolases family 43 n=1 Tax=Mucisphaera calidilacus TaxID=2527982 RepID=A0A518BX69_9BACT|nr:family 43 glycosylhydrolase [Mucisphaera calidilacus]QDU71534.1 Glycosyl hydrolases family 43 [Mucisphaera calidilacus]
MTITIQNTTPRRDIHGRIIDCHDGCLRHFEGRYYLYGTRYGNTDGFTRANRYVCYSSPDLENWTPHGEILDRFPDGIGYRPYVAWNPKTSRYVLWFNWYPELWDGQYGVAVASQPEGPYQLVAERTPVVMPQPGDHNLMVDDDGAGYLIYTSITETPDGHHHLSIERLDETMTTSTQENSGIIDSYVEAPALFRRDRWCYAIFGKTCCFGQQGSDARVYRSRDPLGPWSWAAEINRREDGTIVVPGQQTDVTALPTAEGVQWVWMADLWGSRPDGIKGHDLQHWEPLTFGSDGLPLTLEGCRTWSLTRPLQVHVKSDITPRRPGKASVSSTASPR